MQKVLKEFLPFLMICLLYMLGSDILTAYIGSIHPEFDFYPLTTILLYIIKFYFAASICLLAFLLIYFVTYTIKNYRAKPYWRQLAHNFKNKFLSSQQIYRLILIFLLIPVLFSFIVMYKQLLPFVNPYSWDQTFMHWDYVLHFNHHPWELLQPFIGHPVITAFLGKIYGAWFFVLAGTVIWQTVSTKDSHRMQFFLSFLLCWIILGTGFAYYFSSAGPCYYQIYSHDTTNPYAPLMAYLIQYGPSWVIEVQNSLLTHLMNNTLIFGGGVSAMPSMHVSIATLCFLIFRQQNKWLGMLTFIHLILILIGSIHLAWHYAVDGYAAIILTTVIWYYTGKVLGLVNNTNKSEARLASNENFGPRL